MEIPENAVVVGVEGARLALWAKGHAEYGFLIDGHFEAGSLAGTTSAILLRPDLTIQDLQDLYDGRLSVASISALDGNLRVDFESHRLGALGVEVSLWFAGAPDIRLSYRFGLDQKYLPKIIRSFRQNFPEAL